MKPVIYSFDLYRVSADQPLKVQFIAGATIVDGQVTGGTPVDLTGFGAMFLAQKKIDPNAVIPLQKNTTDNPEFFELTADGWITLNFTDAEAETILAYIGCEANYILNLSDPGDDPVNDGKRFMYGRIKVL